MFTNASLRGLGRAAGMADSSTQPWSPATDPLGLNLQQEARAKRFADSVSNIADEQTALNGPLAQAAHMGGPLPDPQWDAFYQAVSDASGGRPTRFAGSRGPSLGYDTNNGTVGAGTETYGPRGLTLNRRQAGSY